MLSKLLTKEKLFLILITAGNIHFNEEYKDGAKPCPSIFWLFSGKRIFSSYLCCTTFSLGGTHEIKRKWHINNIRGSSEALTGI